MKGGTKIFCFILISLLLVASGVYLLTHSIRFTLMVSVLVLLIDLLILSKFISKSTNSDDKDE